MHRTGVKITDLHLSHLVKRSLKREANSRLASKVNTIIHETQ